MGKKRWTYRILAIVFACVFVFSGIHVALALENYRKANSLYTETQDVFVEKPEEQEETESEKAPISVDFPGLLKQNKDVVGWIYCPDTVIHYPVVQGQDNKQYLHAGLDGKHLTSGTVFVDYRNQEVGQDPNYIVYGHNMINKTMFGSLVNYKKQAYYDKHPVMYYLTPAGNYRIELVAGRVVKTKDLIYQTQPDPVEFYAYLTKMQKKSTFQSGHILTMEDRVITLSTCSYEFDNARYVAVGKLIPLQ